jgi:hypothetical protein
LPQNRRPRRIGDGTTTSGSRVDVKGVRAAPREAARGAKLAPISGERKGYQQCFADSWKKINEDGGQGGARESLRFLARKANSSPAALLEYIILILWPYSLPPARRRAADIDNIKGFARRLQDIAGELRHSPIVGFSADMYHHYYHPRGAAAPAIAFQWPSSPALSPDVVRLPDLLEDYALFLENKVRLMQHYARAEPTESEYRKDCEDDVIGWVGQVAGKVYREKVADILDVLWPPFTGKKGKRAETLRKRAYRLRKSRRSEPAP